MNSKLIARGPIIRLRVHTSSPSEFALFFGPSATPPFPARFLHGAACFLCTGALGAGEPWLAEALSVVDKKSLHTRSSNIPNQLQLTEYRCVSASYSLLSCFKQPRPRSPITSLQASNKHEIKQGCCRLRRTEDDLACLVVTETPSGAHTRNPQRPWAPMDTHPRPAIAMSTVDLLQLVPSTTI